MKKVLLKAIAVLIFIAISQVQASAQSTFLMCSTTTTSDTSGIIYDTGGPSNPYLVSEDCTLLVAPSCATSITLTFQQFATESGWDFFHVYDGQTTAAPELLNTSGNTLPSPVTCTSGYMLIVWHSDFTIVDSGFACSWTSVIAPSVAPNAAFTISSFAPPLSVPVQFTDQSTGGPTAWLWNFGNGDTAKSQNPLYAYSTPGTYTVTLIAFTCNESDTITHTVTVQAAPHISVTPPTGFSASIPCGDSANFTLNIANTGGGQLVYTLDGSLVGSIKVLALTHGTDAFEEYPRTLAAINNYFTNYALTQSATTDPGVLSGLLVGKNVLLIPEHESGNDSVWFNMGPVIRQFLNNGGSVVFLGSFSSYSNDLFWTGVFTGSFVENEAGLSLNVIDNTHPITTGIPLTAFNAPSSTYSMNITNPDKVTLIEYQGNDIVSYRYVGAGKAIFIAFDYYTSTATTQRILANAVEWGGQNALPLWIHLNRSSDTVTAPQTSPTGVTFVGSGLPAGTYYANLGVSSNDPSNPIVIVPCTLTVSGFPIIALSDSCVALGQVMQHTSATGTVRVINSGCDTLFINNINSTNPAFVLNANFSFLLPGAYSDIGISFSSATIGQQNGIINILNNDVDTSVCVSANVFPAPILSTSSGSVIQNLRACGVTGTNSFYITNTGGSNLTYHLGNLPSWVTATTGTGTVAAGSSDTIHLNFSSGIMPGGPYTANLQLISNDPLAPIRNVTLTLNVDYNPCVDFTFGTNTCTGFATFTSTSINTPTSYHWAFGDGDTSNVASPSHPYAHNGTYTTTLIACNSSGCDTVVQNVQAIITGPKATTCYPGTQAYCCGIGVTLFQVTGPFGNLYNKTSSDAIVGYEDFTCTDTATLVTNYPYSVNIKTGFTYAETVKIWLDMNNDGILDPATEQLYVDSNNLTFHAGSLFIPSRSTNVYGEPLRLRVASDYSGNPTPEPCLDLQFGQVEDYSVFLNFFDAVSELHEEASFNVYPNPFDRSTSIDYTLRNSSHVSLEVYNILGEKVSMFLSDESQQSGKHSYQFIGKPSGVYFVKLTVNGKTAVEKIIKM